MLKADSKVSINGTCLQGYLQATYGTLVAKFGQPQLGFDKTQVEWHLTDPDFPGVVVTIYDWKCYGQNVKEITDWNVGGNGRGALRLLGEAMGGLGLVRA